MSEETRLPGLAGQRVAITAGADDSDQPSQYMWAQCFQGGGDSIGRVRVINKNRRSILVSTQCIT